MHITFHPESDYLDLSSSIKEFEEIWKAEGEKIVKVWEQNTGLKFKETVINAIVFDGISHSHPLSLRYNYDLNRKKSVLVHELGHRILYKRVRGMGKASSEDHHKFLFLVLYEVFVELYGEAFAEDAVLWDSNLPRDEYKIAWEWALKFPKDERKKMFNEIIEKHNFEEVFKR